MSMVKSERTFLPAAGRDWLLPLYDPFTRLFGFDAPRQALLDQAAVQPHHRVLDIGCGTGTLTVRIKQQHPDVDVVGLDPDPAALARAQRKAERAGVTVRFDLGFADALGYGEARFDRVFSSMMLHHLAADEKENTLREIHRVLKPGGRLELLDFAGPHTGAHGSLGRLIHSHRRLLDHEEGRMLALMTGAGLVARKGGRRRTLFGEVDFYQAGRGRHSRRS